MRPTGVGGGGSNARGRAMATARWVWWRVYLGEKEAVEAMTRSPLAIPGALLPVPFEQQVHIHVNNLRARARACALGMRARARARKLRGVDAVPTGSVSQHPGARRCMCVPVIASSSPFAPEAAVARTAEPSESYLGMNRMMARNVSRGEFHGCPEGGAALMFIPCAANTTRRRRAQFCDRKVSWGA